MLSPSLEYQQANLPSLYVMLYHESDGNKDNVKNHYFLFHPFIMFVIHFHRGKRWNLWNGCLKTYNSQAWNHFWKLIITSLEIFSLWLPFSL